MSPGHLLPATIDGLPTDVEEVGILRAFAALAVSPMAAVDPRTRIRPAQPGCSIGFADPTHQFVMAGTFGALAKDGDGTYILSNNHVLADEGQLPSNSPIYQPGLLDGGNSANDAVAKLTRFVALQAGGTNTVDCAIAKLDSSDLASNEILEIGAPQGIKSAQIDMIVHKFGRTTNYTVGQVSSIDTDVQVQYETGTYSFTEQIIIVGTGQPFSDAGDSGSLILERASNAAVGLLFAGSSSHTIANHIDQVLEALAVDLD